MVIYFIINLGDKESAKVVTETEFMKIMMERSGSPFWKRLHLIQVCVNSKRGLADTKIVDYYAPVQEDDPSQEINYSFRHFPPDSVLRKTNINLLAIKTCHKICYYISKVHFFEILRMQAYFIKGDNNQLWFYYAKNVRVRPIYSKMKERELYQRVRRLN